MDMVNFETLALISVLTALTTECFKKLFFNVDNNYNLVAASVSMGISLVVCVIYPVFYENTDVSPRLIFRGLVMAFFGVLCSTLSYDKVKETLAKFKE